MIKKKAVELLLDLKRDPYRLPYDWRDLVNRTLAEILDSPLSKIRSWITRVHLALEDQSSRVKLGISDIRRWLIAEHEIDDDSNSQDDSFYMPGDNDKSYDSDNINTYADKSPDEKMMREKTGLCISDRLSVCTTMPKYIHLFSSSPFNNPYRSHPL